MRPGTQQSITAVGLSSIAKPLRSKERKAQCKRCGIDIHQVFSPHQRGYCRDCNSHSEFMGGDWDARMGAARDA